MNLEGAGIGIALLLWGFDKISSKIKNKKIANVMADYMGYFFILCGAILILVSNIG